MRERGEGFVDFWGVEGRGGLGRNNYVLPLGPGIGDCFRGARYAQSAGPAEMVGREGVEAGEAEGGGGGWVGGCGAVGGALAGVFVAWGVSAGVGVGAGVVGGGLVGVGLGVSMRAGVGFFLGVGFVGVDVRRRFEIVEREDGARD